MEQQIKCVLENMGYEILTEAKKTQNGPDAHIRKNNTIFRVEIKKARPIKNSMSVHPIEKNRINDDLVCVLFPSGYVLVEPMKDYLKSCSESGSRSFFGVY